MISTGLPNLDNLLGGGIIAGVITDIFGPSGTGKTQLAMQICVNAISEKILYQDTNGSFRPERVLQLMHAKYIAPDLLGNIIVTRVTNTDEQIRYLKNISQVNPKLVVIDNITDLFSFEYSKESNSLEKHLKFMEYMHSLSLLCIQNKIPVVITNVVRRSGERDKENLDKSISIFTHKKIRLSKVDNKFSAQVHPSFVTKNEITYKISPEGITEIP